MRKYAGDEFHPATGAELTYIDCIMKRLIAALVLCAAGSASLTAQQTRVAGDARVTAIRAMTPRQREEHRRVYLDSLTAGRRRWRSAKISDYLLQTHQSGGLPAPRGSGKLSPLAVLTTVRGGRIIARSRGKATEQNTGPATVDSLFVAIARDMREPEQFVVTLTLHAQLGFPVEYYSDHVRLADAENYIQVDSFAVLEPITVAKLTRADSSLVGRMLLAEDRRDSTDGALGQGARHPDARLRQIALRARVRIRDARATGRDSVASVGAPPLWDEPGWKGWYREMSHPNPDCSIARHWLDAPSRTVRLRAEDVISSRCEPDDAIASTLRRLVDELPANASPRLRDSVSWHAAAHGIVALARMRPAEARPRVAKLARHRQWHVRAYAARAAAVLADTATLRTLARDPNDNVKEQAIEALSKLTGHLDDSLFVAALDARGAQAVRAAAIALKGSPYADVRALVNATFERWVVRQVASARDVRLALLEAAGRRALDDRPPALRHELPPRAVALALGAEVRLRVRMSPTSGGGSFVVRLRGDAAPMMAARILALARAHYYDNTDWHRVEHDFVIQGGSPGSNEYVGAPQFLRDELGGVPHLRGTIGMSTRGHDTGDAQWFVNLKDNRRLDPDYTVFAEVVDGMEVVDDIQEGDVIATIEEVKLP